MSFTFKNSGTWRVYDNSGSYSHRSPYFKFTTPTTWTKDKQVTSGSAICAGGGVTGNVASGAQTSSNYVWSNITAISTARQYPHGVGNASNFTLAGGYNGSSAVENSQTWNGTSWATEIGSSVERRDSAGGAGSYDDIFIAFGRNGSGTLLNSSSKFNGTSWSTEAGSGTAREGTVGTGASDSALFAGGYASGNSSEVNSYNGTSWATVASRAMDSAVYGLSMGASSSDSAHVAGGYPSGYSADFDGSTWTSTSPYPVQAATHFFAGGGGKKDEHLTMGGHFPTSTRYNTTYLWNGTAWLLDKGDLKENKQGGAGDCTARQKQQQKK